MRAVRLIVLALLCQLATWASTSPAMAGEVFPTTFGNTYIDLLPVGEVIGDGKTASTLNVVALTGDGTPLTELKLKPTSTAGETSDWMEIGGGLYTLQFVAAPVSTVTNARITLKGRTAARETINLALEFPVAPSGTGPIVTTANPAGLILGQETDASMTIQVEGINTAIDLDVRAVSGSVDNVTHMGNGQHNARFTPEKVNYPHLGIVTVVDKAHPTTSYGYYAMPLSGRVNYPVQVRPNASVLLKVNDREFGPVQADADGKASIPIIVAPGVTKATVISIVKDSKGEEILDLRVPETRKIDMFSPPASIPSNPQVSIPVRAVVLQAGGIPDETANVIFSATAGSVSEATHEGNGIYVASYTPPESNKVMPATIKVQIAGSSIQEAQREISLIPVRATMMTMTAEPAELPTSATALKVFLKVLDGNGEGLANKDVLVSATGAKLKDIQDMKGGDYKIDFSASNSGDVLVRASVAAAPSKNPLRHVLVIPAGQRVTNDGISSLSIGILTVDEYGYPIPNTKVTLTNNGRQGITGSLPNEITTDQAGSAQFFYTSGQQAGIVNIRAQVDDIIGEAGILQAPVTVPDIYLAPSGTSEYIMHQVAWSEVMGTLLVSRETSGEEVSAMAASTNPRTDGQSDGIVASLSIKVEPTMAIPGGQVTVKVKAVDAQGRGVSGKTLDFLTSAGAFDKLKDAGGGDYEISLSIAEGATEEVKIHVNAPSGAMAMAKLGISDVKPEETAPADAWGAVDDSATPAEPIASTPVEPAKTSKPKPDSSGPWMRGYLSGAMASYRYEQAPSTQPGPLLPQTLAVGKEYGGKNAQSGGIQAGGRIWLPSLRYVGFSGYGRTTRYAIQAAEFNGTASDWLYDFEVNVNGRVPFDIGENTVWLSGKVGFGFTDFMVFKGCLEDGCAVFFEPLSLPGLAIGLEAGVDVGEDFFAIIGVSKGIAYFTVPYSTSFDSQFGYQITDYLFANIGFTRKTRAISLQGQDSGLERGALSDGQTIGNVGVGFSF